MGGYVGLVCAISVYNLIYRSSHLSRLLTLYQLPNVYDVVLDLLCLRSLKCKSLHAVERVLRKLKALGVYICVVILVTFSSKPTFA